MAKFEKGNAGGPGRPKGSVNEEKKKLRELVTNFTEEGFPAFKAAFEKAEPHQQLRTYLELLRYILPVPKEVKEECDDDTSQVAPNLAQSLQSVSLKSSPAPN